MVALLDPAGARRTLIADIQGSVIASLDAGSGALTKQSYAPYGQTTGAFPFGYTGRRTDAETGLTNNHAWLYHPVFGRFVQNDPIGYAGGYNLYAYVGNDPLNFTDPDGLVKDYVQNSWQALSGGVRNFATTAVSDPGDALRQVAGALPGIAPPLQELGVLSQAASKVVSAAEGGLTAAEQLAANRATGAAFEQAVGANLEQRGLNVGQQITMDPERCKDPFGFSHCRPVDRSDWLY
ncbi:RHS repeat-associated core domain-containing protein [Methylosinus sp. Ce-a6]|uniref:RHS repeat-associated core domain-containing protein n=1 Tax=Methylosinus sp. Ce-a6 TaxID=2172005 RepID=UPI0019165E0A|nr:RHS repeat-associated core domain-containing protein [Methylosinus sp. Ce-a6]